MEEIVVVYYVEKMSKMGNFMLIRILFYLFNEKGAIFTTRRSNTPKSCPNFILSDFLKNLINFKHHI